MQINELPAYDAADNPTGCCPRFNPQGGDGQELHFVDKPFVRATTVSLLHILLNMGRVFARTSRAIKAAGAHDDRNVIVLSRELSPWRAEHYFAVSKEPAGEDVRRLSGHYLTKVFEGPFRDAPKWEKEMQGAIRQRGKRAGQIYAFYTTCPRCAKHYGKNYVVMLAEVA